VKAAETARLVISHLESLEIAPSEKGRFDERDFLDSLRNQAKVGKAFSPRQLNALKRLITNHKDSIPAYQEVITLLGISEERSATDPAMAAAVSEHLSKLEAVTSWESPTKKGRRLYDDKAFFESLLAQHKKKSELSPKQIAALKKLAAKYLHKTTEAS